MNTSAYRRVRRLAARAVQQGKRGVVLTQETAGLGNFLYEWMFAWGCRRRGEDVVCLLTPKMEPWLAVFHPSAEPLVVRRERIRITDRRIREVHNEFGVHFDRSDIEAFAAGFLSPSGVIDQTRVPPDQLLTERDVLLNVRRGDYHSVEENRRRYAFDLDEYLVAALESSRESGGPIVRLHVVSDDIGWCQAELPWLAHHCRRLTFEDQGLAPQAHFALVTNAPRLVLANSTFSYWAGYVSAWRTGHPEWVVAPWFHMRGERDGAAWQLDPRWSIVRDIPSHWGLLGSGCGQPHNRPFPP